MKILIDKEPINRYTIEGKEMIRKAAGILGKIKTRKKAASSRRNGLLGGRPRKTGK